MRIELNAVAAPAGLLGSERVYAPVPEGRGLAVYFWLRLGFRPLSRAESPKSPLGLTGDSKPGIWMVRDGNAPETPLNREP